mmetsp:Transcript_24862/g.71320  ORF Transcript_24862/g.71320 Transcript_24862/m.71320 type:complete len:239 (-) Transcript_24862:314-1030(-)
MTRIKAPAPHTLHDRRAPRAREARRIERRAREGQQRQRSSETEPGEVQVGPRPRGRQAHISVKVGSHPRRRCRADGCLNPFGVNPRAPHAQVSLRIQPQAVQLLPVIPRRRGQLIPPELLRCLPPLLLLALLLQFQLQLCIVLRSQPLLLRSRGLGLHPQLLLVGQAEALRSDTGFLGLLLQAGLVLEAQLLPPRRSFPGLKLQILVRLRLHLLHHVHPLRRRPLQLGRGLLLGGHLL